MTVPNVLATRYAAPDLARSGRPEHKVVLERRLWIAVLERPARPRGRRTRRRRRGLRDAVVDKVDLDLDRRARAGDPPRREGADRGVRRARRARAHPQGHDLAATSPRTSSSSRCASPSRCCATARSPPWPGSRRLAAEHEATVMAGRSHNVAAQATTLGKRFATVGRRAAGRARARRGPARALPAARHQGPDGHRAGHARPARRRRGQARRARAAGRRPPRLRAGAHQRRPGLPALARLRRGLRRWCSWWPARPTWPPRSG